MSGFAEEKEIRWKLKKGKIPAEYSTHISLHCPKIVFAIEDEFFCSLCSANRSNILHFRAPIKYNLLINDFVKLCKIGLDSFKI